MREYYKYDKYLVDRIRSPCVALSELIKQPLTLLKLLLNLPDS